MLRLDPISYGRGETQKTINNIFDICKNFRELITRDALSCRTILFRLEIFKQCLIKPLPGFLGANVVRF